MEFRRVLVLSVNAIDLFSDGDEAYLPDAALVADLYDNGSGMPSISNLTIDAFGFGVPGVDDFPRISWGRSRPAAWAMATRSRSFPIPTTSRRFSPPQHPPASPWLPKRFHSPTCWTRATPRSLPCRPPMMARQRTRRASAPQRMGTRPRPSRRLAHLPSSEKG